MKMSGLTSSEVRERIAQGLRNQTSESHSKRITEILAENLFSVFNAIVALIIGTLLFYYFRSGDIRLPLDAIGVFSIAVINTTLAVVQEIRAKQALDKVNLLLKRNVTVVRDGNRQEIEQTEIVVGDLIVLERGDQIVVDGKIEVSNHLEIDESQLSGESIPIEKQTGETVLSGSFCLSGNGLYIAEKVGDNSFAAQVTGTARKFKIYQTPLQRQLSFIVKSLFVAALLLVALELIYRQGNGLSEVDFVRKLSTLVISLVPHGLVLMSSVTLALGVYRISQLGAIIQKLNAVESFSNVKLVCADKTGTLTQNKLSIRRVTVIDPNSISQAEVERLLGIYSELSSDKNATLRTLEKFAPHLAEFLRAGATVKLVGEIPFSSERKMSLIKVKIDGEPYIFVLGGFDVLISSSGIPGMRGKAERIIKDAGLEVYRNLLFGRVLDETSLEEIRKDFSKLTIEPLGVVSISDEIRPDALEAIKLFQLHGVDLKILSGDAAESVRAIAHEIGWNVSPDKVITGAELDVLDEEGFTKAALEKAIFSRLNPEHKLRLIKTFRKAKIHTAMIGDGVNDLPAIKEADLGIAMEEGSPITKEVSDIVLLKNKFSLLPQIFDEGNRIINSVNAIAKLFLTKNFLVIYLALAALIFGFVFPLTPRRVSLLNIFTIALPAFVIALKNRDTSRTRHFALDLFTFVTLSGLLVCLAGFASEFAAEIYYSASEDEIQMIMLSVLTATSIANFLVVTLRNRASWTVDYLIYGLGILTLYIFLATTTFEIRPLVFLKLFYEITTLPPRYWGLVAGISLASAALLFILQKAREMLVKK